MFGEKLLNYQNVYDRLSRHCTCAKAVLKRPLYFLPSLTSKILASYGNCPVNVMGGIVGRHSYTHLIPDPIVLRKFREYIV